MSFVKNILGPMRPPFLILTPACVLLGVGTASWTSGSVDVLHAVLALIGALGAHISVNAFNEYSDYKSGLDLRTERTPFSGGSGTLPAHPEMARSALITAVTTFALTGLIGVFFLFVRGMALLPLGVLGLVIVIAYTPYITRHPLLCLIAPGLGFGPLMVMGTHVALTGVYSWSAFFASLVPLFLVSDLLLLNQFPDVDADRSIGRKHYPIVIGNRGSAYIYAAFLALTYLSLAAGVCLGHLPLASLFGMATLVLAAPAAFGAYRHSDNRDKLIPFMGMNVIITIATPVLVAVGLLIS